MLFTTEQWILLAVTLIAGYLLGYASRPSARKWQRKATAQSESFTAYHTDAEDRVRAAKERAKALEAEAAALRSDREEAERTIAALRAERTAAPAPVVVRFPEGDGAVVHTEARSVYDPKREPTAETPLAQSRPDAAARDDLARIRGIDGPLGTRLSELGVQRFQDLETLSAEDEIALERRLALPAGTIARDQWRAQAALLRAGHNAEHAERFS